MNRPKQSKAARLLETSHPGPLYVAGAFVLLSLAGGMAAVANVPSPPPVLVETRFSIENLSIQPPLETTSAGQGFFQEETILRSDTIGSLLQRLGVTDRDALEFIRQNELTRAAARQLRPGLSLSAETDENGKLLALHFPLGGKDTLLSVQRGSAGFTAMEAPPVFETRTHIKSAEITHSLFGATDNAGIPDAVATQMADIFGGDIDFHRDLRKGDRFSVVYETLSLRGQTIRSGRILSAEFTNDQKTYEAHWFVDPSTGQGAYYTPEGKSLRKAFLRSPLEFSRVSSGFTSARLHPVLRTWRAHKGIDYAAPIGTRIRAVADGTIEFIGRQGGYGNLVIIRHQGSYSTAYGHLNGFASGLRKGSKVSQGDIIGQVGQTGLASGPHLHYEFRINNQQVNPQTVALPQSVPLDSSKIARYKDAISTQRQQLDLARRISYASVE